MWRISFKKNIKKKKKKKKMIFINVNIKRY